MNSNTNTNNTTSTSAMEDIFTGITPLGYEEIILDGDTFAKGAPSRFLIDNQGYRADDNEEFNTLFSVLVYEDNTIGIKNNGASFFECSIKDGQETNDFHQYSDVVVVNTSDEAVKIITDIVENERNEELIECEGCNRELPEPEMSDVMEMYICNRCNDGANESNSIQEVKELLSSIQQSGLENVIKDSEFTWDDNQSKASNIQKLAEHCVKEQEIKEPKDKEEMMEYLNDIKVQAQQFFDSVKVHCDKCSKDVIANEAGNCPDCGVWLVEPNEKDINDGEPGEFMTLEEAEELMGKTVNVLDNPSACAFKGQVVEVKKYLAGGVIVSVLDENDNTFHVQVKHIEPLKFFRVCAIMESTLVTTVEASSIEEAWKIAKATDGGQFSEVDGSGQWNVDSVTEEV